MREPSARAETRVMAVGALALVVAALPVFLLGGLAVQIRSELGFSESGLGAAITAFFVASGLGSIPGGRLGDRIGPQRALLSGSAVTAVALLVLAAAQTWLAVAVGLLVGGLAIGISEPGIALLLSAHVRGARQGIAFGIKEAAIPGATLLAGISVPLVALTVGWRWAFVAAVALVPFLWASFPRVLVRELAAAAHRQPDHPDRGLSPADGRGNVVAAPAPTASAGPAASTPPPPTKSLAVVALGCGLGVAAVTAMGSFFVEGAVASGVSPAGAGWLLSGGSVAGMAGRVTAGWLADRNPKPQLPVVAAMLVGGAVALLLLALAASLGPPRANLILVVGTLGAFSVGWGWTGLLFLSAVRASPAAPGGAAGIALAGLSIGGASGPLLFGVTVAATSYAVAWSAGALSMLAGAGLVLVGNRMLARSSTLAQSAGA